jgi:hypothetical protein
VSEAAVVDSMCARRAGVHARLPARLRIGIVDADCRAAPRRRACAPRRRGYAGAQTGIYPLKRRRLATDRPHAGTVVRFVAAEPVYSDWRLAAVFRDRSSGVRPPGV